MKTLKVLKFGGSSFPRLASYADIAAYLARRLEEDASRIVVVVSAMSGTTGRIQEAALEVNPELSPELTDSILGTGEIVAACLMRAALERQGVVAAHLSGYQLGVTTDSKFTRARPREVCERVLRERLAHCQVLVVAGGQAVDETGRMTMLGRNSSDLSAVILAAALGAPECEIFSDVPGVYSADPYLIPEARPIAELPYDAIVALSRGGAKVLHHGAVSYAREHGVVIRCRATGTGETGSVIGRGMFPAAVAAHTKVEVLQFADEAARDRAAGELDCEGIVALPVDLGGDPYLAVSLENRGWEEALCRVQESHVRHEGWAVLTMTGGVDQVMRRLVRLEDSAEEARRAHALMYPGKGAQAPASRQKARAAESGLLV